MIKEYTEFDAFNDKGIKSQIVWSVIGFFSIYIILVIIFSRIVSIFIVKSGYVLLIEVAADFLAAMLATCLFTRREGLSFRSVGLKMDRRWFADLILGLGLGGLVLLMAAFLLQALGGLHWTLAPTGRWKGLGPGVVLFLVAAFHEELVFRGYPFQRLAAWCGAGWAQAVGTLLFVAIHWNNVNIFHAAGALKAVTMVNLMLAGLFLGLAWLKTRSLGLPIGIHLGWNLVQGPLLGFDVSGNNLSAGIFQPILQGPEWLTGGKIGLEGSVCCTAACLLGITCLGLRPAMFPKKTRQARLFLP